LIQAGQKGVRPVVVKRFPGLRPVVGKMSDPGRAKGEGQWW